MIPLHFREKMNMGRHISATVKAKLAFATRIGDSLTSNLLPVGALVAVVLNLLRLPLDDHHAVVITETLATRQ